MKDIGDWLEKKLKVKSHFFYILKLYSKQFGVHQNFIILYNVVTGKHIIN